MTTIDLNAATVERPGDRFQRDEAEQAAASFSARYSGRTLEAYRHDLRGFFQWAADNRRQDFDRHAAYAVVAFVAGG